ncbi:MAG: hypothetical protein QXG65_02265 [Thermoplasmata archaeon]
MLETLNSALRFAGYRAAEGGKSSARNLLGHSRTPKAGLRGF